MLLDRLKTRIRSAPTVVAAAIAIGALTVFAHPLHTSHVALALSVDEASEQVQALTLVAEQQAVARQADAAAWGAGQAMTCPMTGAASVSVDGECQAAEGCSGGQGCSPAKGCEVEASAQASCCRADQGVDAVEDFEP